MLSLDKVVMVETRKMKGVEGEVSEGVFCKQVTDWP